MRVLQLIDTLNIGGAERLAVTYANALATDANTSFLCTTRKEGLLKSHLKPEVGYLHAARKKVLDRKAVVTVVHFIKQHKIDVIHAHGTSFLFAFLVKKKMSSIKVIWHLHSGNLPNASRSKKLMMRYCMPSIDSIICVNDHLKTWMQSKFKKKRVVYLRNFVNFDAVTTSVDRPVMSGDKVARVVCLANLRNPKDHHTLIDAFAKVVSEIPEANLILLGQDFEDAYSKTLKEKIAKNKLEKRVTILGLQAHPDRYLKESKVGVLSSTSEGLPMSLLEYGRAGLIPVVTRVGQCAEVVGEAGFVVQSNDASALGKAICDALRSTPNDAFREKIKKEYSQQAIISSLLQEYTIAVEGK